MRSLNGRSADSPVGLVVLHVSWVGDWSLFKVLAVFALIVTFHPFGIFLITNFLFFTFHFEIILDLR